MRKKLLAIVMSLTMILVFVPTIAFAEEPQKEVLSIAFMSEEPKIVYDYFLIDECELTEDGYLCSPELMEGDSLIINYKDGTTSTYILTEGDEGAFWVNENEPDYVILMEDVFFGPACIPESAADGDSFEFEIEYSNVKTMGTVVFKSANISRITYTPKMNEITLYKSVDEISDEEGTYFDFINAYDQLSGIWKEKVLFEYNDGTSETFALDEIGGWDYVTWENGEYISLREAQQETPWATGDTFDIFLKARGKIDTTNKITVKIETSSYTAFTFSQSQNYLYVFETDMVNYDSDTDEYVLEDADNERYSGSEGDALSFTLNDGSKVEFEYGRIEDDPDYPDGWDGFVTTDANGKKSRLIRAVTFKDDQVRWKKDSNGHYINNSAELTYMGAVSAEPVVSYVGYQVWLDPNGGDGNANTGVPIGMSVNDLPFDFINGFQPSRSGYTFSGWYEKDPQTGELETVPYDFDTKIYEETFLYAKWEEATAASGTCGDNLTWELDDEGTLTISGSGEMYNYSYPDFPFGEYATSIREVIISDGVTSIGNYAFYKCSNLTDITIPDSVTSIGYSAFEECRNLASITIPDSVTSIRSSTFYNCSSLTSVTIPDSVTFIDSGAFDFCSSLTSITIPDSVTDMGTNVFINCSSLTNVTIPGSLTTIREMTFESCSSLASITIPDGVTSIGGGAFLECSSLTNISIPDSVTSIGSYAFGSCSSLTSITIPGSVKSLGTRALNNCSELKYIFFGGTEDEWMSLNCTDIGNAAVHYNSTGDHTWDSGEVTTEPTCTTEGVKTYTCSVCGDTKTETIPATGHIWNEEYTTDKEATCKEEGSKSIHCSVCDAIDETTVTVSPKADHTYGEWTVTAEATCTADGSKEKVCSVCGDKVTEVIPANGHSFSEEFTIDVDPTCTTEGSKSKHCTKCNEKTEVTTIDALGHSFGSWVEITPSSCEGEGVRQRTCDACGFSETETTDPKGHEWEDDYTVDSPATCTTDGSESIHCRNCEVTKDSRVIVSTGHAYGGWIITDEPTCTETGSKEMVCSACGDKVVEEIPALDHTWNSEPTVDKSATCTEEGSQSIHCARCGTTKDETVVPAFGHQWNETPTVDKKATCTADGAQSIHCSVCGEVKEGSETAIPKTGHSFSTWKTTKAATEIAAGQKTRTCSHCGRVEKATIAMLKPTLPAVTIKAPKAAKKAATVKWTKFSKAKQKKIGYFQIQYSTDKKFKTGVKTVTAKKTAASKKITKLTSKKVYYVRIRSYLKSGSKVHVSKWSTVKSVKAK